MTSHTAPTSNNLHLSTKTNGLQERRKLPHRKIRVLCLHGHRTNAKVMINQTKGLRAAMGDELAEFIFLDAPLPAAGPTDPAVERVHGQDAPFYEWWNAEDIVDLAEDETKWTWTIENHTEALTFMDQKLLEIGPVDVVMGFSQGCLLLTVLSMLHIQAKKEIPWKLCVCVGAVKVCAIQFRDLMETPDGRPILVPLPSIHLIGRADPFSEESLGLADQYDSHTAMFPASPLKKMVVHHDEGHKFPSAKKHKALYEKLAKVIVEHCRACDQEDTSMALARL